MTSFYKNLRKKGATKAEALRRAKLDFISGRREGTAGRKKNDRKRDGRKTGDRKKGDKERGVIRVRKGSRDLSHPYYWAPFVLSGDGSSIH